MSVQPVTAARQSPSLSVVMGVLRNMSRRRAQRLALSELLTMPSDRLDDLGIDLGDITEAFNCLTNAGPILEARRAARAEERLVS